MDVFGSVKHPAAQTEPVQTPVGNFAWCTFFVFYINSCCLGSDLIAASRCYIKQQASYFIYISQPGRPASPLPGGWLIRGWCKFKRCHSGVLARLAHRIVYSPPTSCLSDTAGVLGEASRMRLWHRSSLQWEDKVKLDLLDSSSLHGQICVFIFAAFFCACVCVCVQCILALQPCCLVFRENPWLLWSDQLYFTFTTGEETYSRWLSNHAQLFLWR